MTKMKQKLEQTGKTNKKISKIAHRVGRRAAPTTDFSIKLGELLKKARELKQLRQADVAKALGLAIAVYGRYERGEATLTVARLLEICKITGISPFDIIFALDPTILNENIETANNIHVIQNRINNMTSDQLNVLLSLTVAFDSSDNKIQKS